MGLLIYAGITSLLALAILKKQSRSFLLLLQFLPFLFLFFFLWFTRSNYQILHVKKVGYQFEKVTTDFRSPSRRVSIGGDQQKDDVFTSDLSPNAVQITPSLSGLNSEIAVPNDGVIVSQNQQYLNALYLEDGDRIGCGNEEFMFQSKGAFNRSIKSKNREWKWPNREWGLQKHSDRSYFSLSEISKALNISCDSKATFDLSTVRFEAGRNPVRMNAVQLLAAGSNIRVNGQAIPSNFTVNDGDTLKLYSTDDPTGRPALVFSFQIRNRETLNLLLSTPQVLGVKEELLRNGSAVNKPLFLSTTSLPYSVFPTAHYAKESQRFSGLFAFVQTQDYQKNQDLLQQIETRIRNSLSITTDSVEVVTDQGSFKPSYGENFALGRRDRMIFTIDKVDFPWLLLQAVLLLTLAKLLFQPPFFAAIENVPMQLLVVSADFFLTTRLLFSFRASSLYPFSSETVTASLYALLIVPYLIFSAALLIRNAWERRQASNFAFYSSITVVLSAILLESYLWLTVALVIVFTTAAFIRFHAVSPLSATGRKSAPGNSISKRISSIGSGPVDLYLGLFLGLAILLQMLGTGEAIQAAGIRFPLALIYHPVLLVFAGHYLFKLKTIATGRNGQTLQKALGILLRLFSVITGFLIVSLLTADLGFFLLYCTPVLFLLFGISILYLREYELKWKSAGLLMAAPVVLFIFIFAGAGIFDRILPGTATGNRYVQRILLTLNPSVLEQSGLIATERQLGHQRTFVAYSHSGFFGGGYMGRPVSSALSGTALNDNVPAAFLLNDFGVFGFLGILLMLGLWTLLWVQNRSQMNTNGFLSLSALITFIYVDLYMILSNCGIFLFTGKNVFFWGLNSISDIFHSSMLLFFIAAILPVKPPPAPQKEHDGK